MATKKAASTKKASVHKPAAAKTTVRTVKADAKSAEKPVVVKSVAATASKKTSVLPDNIVSVVFAELVGTFILALAALLPFSVGLSGVNDGVGAIVIGLTVAVIVMMVGAISGAHVNPAVTFGLWTMRRLKTVLVPFYWGAQFLGAMLAVIVVNLVANNILSLNFGHIGTMNWAVFGVEVIGTAVFLFGFTAATTHRDLSVGGRALGVGASLLVAAIVSGSLLSAVKTDAIATYQTAAQKAGSTSTPEIPHAAYVKGAALNPAIALASTEKTQSELVGSSSTTKEASYSRFTLEVVLGTLIGAALGGNLYLLLLGRKK